MKKALQWIYSVSTILFGVIALFGLTAKSGIMFILSGLLINPKITCKIPKFKMRNFLIIVIAIILMFMGLVYSSDESTTVTEQGNQAGVSNTQDSNLPDKVKFEKWMASCITEDGIVVNESDCKDWSEYPEDKIFIIWRDIVLNKVSNITDVKEAADYISSAEMIYSDIYENSTTMSEIKDALIDVTSCYGDNNRIANEYKNIDFESARKYNTTNDFYITQRLESEYSSSILGDLQKAYDDYTAEGSLWIGYNVEYSFGTAIPGENCYVLRSTELNPFAKSDVYSIMYYDTGTTTQIKNNKGFVYDAPVYQIINNPDKFTEDMWEYDLKNSLPEGLYQRLLFIIEKDKYADMLRSSESIDTYELSGLYIGKDSKKYSLSMFSAPEGSEVGNLDYNDIIYNLYEIDTNRFIATEGNKSFVIGFTMENSSPVMHIYENGILKDSITISEHYYS